MASIKFLILFFVLILVIITTDSNEEVPYWTEMRQLLKYQSIDTRIINGQLALRDQAPWMVSLAHTFNFKHFCGGALIGERTILTAGHCFIEGMNK